ncbi:MAG: amidase domain-containing protein [Clostridiales bacterium]|nr:amidase domain-containing protein [Clostridiales bacterium]
MGKFKAMVSICLAVNMFTIASPLVSLEKLNVKASEINEVQQTSRILNKTTRLTDEDAKAIVQSIQLDLENGYQSDFRFDNFRAIFVDVENDQNYVDVDVIVDMTYISNPTETPYVQGMIEALENITNLEEKAVAQQVIDEYLEEQMLYYNVPDETTFCYRIGISDTLKSNNNYEMYSRTDISEDEVVLSQVPYAQYEEVRPGVQDGKEAIMEEVQESKTNYVARAVTYSASDAVTYAKDHAKDVPEFSKENGMGSDCANFVSKCINAGGIPVDEKGKWNPSPKAGSYAGIYWMRTGYYKDSDGNYSGVKTYMIDKGYFKAISSTSSAKKGGFMFWNSTSHVALVVSNTSGTIKYSQHSNVQQTQVTKTYSSEDVTFYNPN